jgi:hypothetical protein
LFRAAVVDGGFAVFDGHCDGEWWDINHSDQDANIACDTYICTAIDEGRRVIGLPNLNQRLAIEVYAKDAWASNHLYDTVGDRRRGW